MRTSATIAHLAGAIGLLLAAAGMIGSGAAGESPGLGIQAVGEPQPAPSAAPPSTSEATVEPAPARGARPAPVPDGWQRGFAFWDRSAPYGSPESFAALARLRDLGADTVSPLITWYVAHPRAPVIHRGRGTPSDEDLAAAIDEAHHLGLRVVLRFHVDCEDGAWRATISPDDRDTWFASYGAALNHYAALAEAHGVEGMVIGAELVRMTTPAHTHRWQKMIAEVRQRFSGFLTYSAQWGSAPPESAADPYREYEQVGFWPDLDYLGIAAYFELAPHGGYHPSADDLRAAWEVWRERRIGPFQARYGMPLLFTEVGYRSTNGAAWHPWDGALSQGANPQLQADLFQALFESWAAVPWFRGGYFWFWATDGDGSGLSSVDYPPTGKPAEQVVRRWYAMLDQIERAALQPPGAGGTIQEGEGG